MNRTLLRGALLLIAVTIAGCAGFALEYQNGLNSNYAFTASSYTGASSVGDEGVEGYDFQDPNLPEYSSSKFPEVIFGMRSLDYRLTNYNRDDGVGAFHALLVPPGKTDADAIVIANYEYSNKRFRWSVKMPGIARSFMVGTSYAAPSIVFNNKLLQQKFGSGIYTVIWINTNANGKAERREMSRSSTKLTP